MQDQTKLLIVGLFVLSGLVGCSATTIATPTNAESATGKAVWWKPAGGCPAGSIEASRTCGACNAVRPEDCRFKCEHGDGNSCALLALVYELPINVPRDSRRSFGLYRRACDLGSGDGCEGLAGQQIRGDGCAKDEAAALELLEPMCKAGRGSACVHAARVYLARPSLADRSNGFDLLEDGCLKGSPDGCRLVAEHCPQYKPDDAECARRARESGCALQGADADWCGRSGQAATPIPQQ